MRPIAGREIAITRKALTFSQYTSADLLERLERRKPGAKDIRNPKEAALDRIAIRRVLRIRHGDNWRVAAREG